MSSDPLHTLPSILTPGDRTTVTPPPDLTTWPPGWHSDADGRSSGPWTVELAEAREGGYRVFVDMPLIPTRDEAEALCMALAWALHRVGGGK